MEKSVWVQVPSPTNYNNKFMKNVLKLFFICVCFFISLSANACGIEFHAFNFSSSPEITDTITVPQEELILNTDDGKHNIVCTNRQRQEISNSSNRKNNFNSSSTDKATVQRKLIQQIFNTNYNKILYSNSHKISSYLKNEICTRAP